MYLALSPHQKKGIYHRYVVLNHLHSDRRIAWTQAALSLCCDAVPYSLVMYKLGTSLLSLGLLSFNKYVLNDDLVLGPRVTPEDTAVNRADRLDS